MKLTLTVPAESTGQTLDHFLIRRKDLSRSLINRMKKERRILVNGTAEKTNFIISNGDVIELYVDIDRPKAGVTPENLDLEIIYEDEALIAINKGPGMVVHPVSTHQSGTVANGIAYILSENGKPPIVRPVSRLDRDTTGIIVFAKNSFIQENLIRQMKTDSFEKEYLAIIHGYIDSEKGIIDQPISRTPGSIMLREVNPLGQEAKTHYDLIDRNEKSSLLKLKLETGRTHQIRVHLKYIGHPIIGDDLYLPDAETYGMGRQALHSHMTSFIHPLTKKALMLNAPMPKDMCELLTRLELQPKVVSNHCDKF